MIPEPNATLPSPANETTARELAPSLVDATVMMIDDEPMMTEVIQAYLEESGYTRFIGSNEPQEALALVCFLTSSIVNRPGRV